MWELIRHVFNWIIERRWAIAVSTWLIGVLLAHFAGPVIEMWIRCPSVEITYPIGGETVCYSEEGSTVVGSYQKLRHDHIYVLLHPTDTDLWWAHGPATILNENTWCAIVRYGEGPDKAGKFEIIALLTDETLNTKDPYTIKAFNELRRGSSDDSEVVTVNKVPNGDELKIGTLQVTSEPSDALFVLSGPVSYGGITPWNEPAAPVGEYTITWGLMSDHETPPSESMTLSENDSASFSGIYLPNTFRLTIATSGPGITCPGMGTHIYDKGDRVTITAIPASDGTFHHWGGGTSGSSTTTTLTMDEDITAIAYFDIDYTRECEEPDAHDVGMTVDRADASGLMAHGQFGCNASEPYSARAGYVEYNKIELDDAEHLYVIVRYSKNSESTTPIEIYLNGELRASFIPVNQGDWDTFTETLPIDLGPITAGTYTIRFSTEGQQYGVADLDQFSLSYFSE